MGNNVLSANVQNQSGIQIPKLSMPQVPPQIGIQSCSIEKTDKC